ncbi:hypothetical protein G6F61_014663 [Rhizopus arrhizus]|nr:hypothetical protein G6F61_014663 [Rhizopus arrhizus]
MPTYPDPVALDAALHELKRLPPLVTSWEILAVKQQLAEAQEGKRFLLQGGAAADEPGAGARPAPTGDPRWALCRPVRQAAFGRYRNPRWRDPAQLPW